MKILLINWQDPANPRSGGAEVHLHEIFRRLAGRGHDVTWLVSGWKGAEPRDRFDGMEVHRAGTRYTFGAASVRYFRRRLSARPFDLTVEALNKVPVYSPLWVGTPVILLVHHLFGRTAFQEAPAPLAAATWLQERPLHRVYRGCQVEAISASTADDLVARGFTRDRVEVIHPGVDLDFFRPASSPTRAIVPTFLYVGRLQRYKRVDLVLHAFALLRADVPGARLTIAGKGDRLESLRKLAASLGIAEAVTFAGFVTEEQKRALMRAAWANVFVSPKEGWGITNLEAAACGTPTIASDSPGLRESVVAGRTGLLVPHGELNALALAMRRLALDPGLVEELGAGAADFARSFGWDHAARRTEDHLELALARSTGAAPDGPGPRGGTREDSTATR